MNYMPLTRAAEILLVEDNPSDVRLTVEAMREGKVLSNLHVVGDGEEALDFLLTRGKHERAVRPDLILLDLNLPKMDGRQVLSEIKTRDDLANIPVVVLSTSSDEEDVARSYALHANCFISKPMDLDEFINVVQQIENFWLSIVTLPERN